MKKLLLCLLTFVLLGSLSAQSDTLGTGTVVANTSTSAGSGAVFNLHAQNSIRLTEISNRISSAASGYEVWYNTDSVNGQPTINAANGWVLHETGSLTGTNNLMFIQLANPILITAGETYGIYFRVLGTSLLFTSEASFASTTFSDGNARLNVGGTSGCVYILPTGYLDTYCFVGDIVYELAITAPNDATVLTVDSPRYFCAGTKDIYATVANYGINQIDSVEINWEFNGVAQPSVHYKQTLDIITGTNPFSATVLLGSGNFPTGVENSIKVWTSQPNGVADTITRNDTLEVLRKAALTGNYTIDAGLPASASNYRSFTNLASDLNAYGVCGPVYVTVSPGTYTEYFNLKKVGGTSAINTITIDGQDSSTTILTNNSNTSASSTTVALDGTEYITLKNMTFEATFSGYINSTVLKLNNANHNTITNNRLLSDSTTTYFVVNNIDMTGSYNILANNYINGGGYYGITMVASGVDVHNQLLNNEIYNIYYYGLQIQNQDSIEIIGNTIDVTRGDRQNYALMVYYSTNAKINRNHIRANGYGFYFYNYNNNTFSPTTRKIEINNNMIIAEGPGFFSYYLDSVNIMHNSISSTGSSPAVQINAYTAPPSANYDMRNNIFSSRYGPAVVTNYPITLFDSLDHNIYYTTGSNLLTINATDYASLADLQTAFPQMNVNSIQGDPQFVSPMEDLHILGALANDAGDNTVGITVDIDGDSRPMAGSTTVDIGADEYDAPLCPPIYGLTASNPTLDSVTIGWMPGSGTYQYEVLAAGQALGTGTRVQTTTETERIGGLTPSTAYEFYVRQLCGAGDTSMWWGPFEFYTASSLVFSEDFDNFPTAELSNGWTNSSYAIPHWSVDAVANSALGFPMGGPTMDHTTGFGKFAYFTVDYNAGSSSLLSPLIYVDSNRSSMKFSFWYHMFGSDMGTLNVYIDSNGVSNLVTTITGQQQFSGTDPWLQFTSYLTGYQGKYIQLRFEGAKSTGYYSAMAIDDVLLDTVPPLNVAVAELVSPSGAICAGTITPILGVMNTGQAAVNSVMIYWNVNGTLDSLLYTTTINSGDTAQVTLGSITLNGTSFYDIQFYAKNPNSTPDPIPLDDTLSFDNLRTGLFRSYTVDPVIPSSFTVFNTVSEAADALNKYGVCGAVDITIASGTYNEAVVLGEISGASAINNILFDGQDSSTTTITHDGTMQHATWTFNGADYVTLKNVTVENTNGSQGAAILFAGGADYNTVSNSELKVNNTSSAYGLDNVLFSASISSRANGVRADYNTIANNKIDGGYFGLYMYASDALYNHHTSILNNVFSNQYYYGIYTYFADSTDIVGNHIDMTRNSNAYGLNCYFAANIKFNENYVHAGGYGLNYLEANGYVSNTRVMEMNNNMIISDNNIGLYLYLNMRNQATVEVHHTSISSEDDAINLTLYGPLPDFDIRNTILKSNSGTAITSNSASTNFGPMDNNIYFTGGNTLFQFPGSQHADLASFQTAVPSLNISSFEADPQFVSATDLHVIGRLANDKGDNSVLITTDIDGDARPMTGSTIVDIGADEFDPPSCPPVMNMTASNPSGSSITLEWEGLFTNFEYEIVLKGAAQGTGTSSIVASDSVRASGLSPLTSYDYYVREICGRGDTSVWWGPISFTTGDPANDLSLFALDNPTQLSSSCYTATNAVEVIIRNEGNIAIDFATDTVDVTVVVSGAVSQTYNYQLNSNSLNFGNPLGLGNSITVPMGNLDMTTVGTYAINAYLSGVIDTLNANDSLSASISNNPVGGSLNFSNTVCGSGMVTLNTVGSEGELQWQRLANGAFGDEPGADSTSYSVFIDSVTTFRVAACGTEFSDTLTVRPDLLPATPTVVNDTAIVFCGDSGTAVLTANTITTATINWYSDSVTTSVLTTGDSLYYGVSTSVQPITTAYSDTFYVSVIDPVNGCESERAMVSGTVLCTVGAMEMKSETAVVSIIPNPSKGVFNLVGSNLGEEISVSIYNMSGKMVYQMENKVSNDFNEQIDLSDLSKGIYFIRLQGERSMEMMKIVIQ